MAGKLKEFFQIWKTVNHFLNNKRPRLFLLSIIVTYLHDNELFLLHKY